MALKGRGCYLLRLELELPEDFFLRLDAKAPSVPAVPLFKLFSFELGGDFSEMFFWSLYSISIVNSSSISSSSLLSLSELSSSDPELQLESSISEVNSPTSSES